MNFVYPAPMSETISAITEEVCRSLLARGTEAFFYPAEKFDETAKRDDLPHIRFPSGPGGRVYRGTITAFRATGQDPGFKEDRWGDVPQAYINASRIAFSDALHQAFSPQIIKRCLQAQLESDPFLSLHINYPAPIDRIYRQQMPRITRAPQQDSSHPFQLSLSHDIRRNCPAGSNVLEPHNNRHNLTNYDLLCSYRFLKKNPEVAVGFFLWQKTIAAYAESLKIELVRQFRTAARSRFGNIHEDCPLLYTVNFAASNMDVATIPLFFTAAMLAQAHNQSGSRLAEPSANDALDGIRNTIRSGIFRRRFPTPDGERKTACPFGPFGVRWLLLDMGDKEDPADAAIVKCIEAVTAERHFNPEVEMLCKLVQNAMKIILSESDQDLIAELDRNIAQAKISQQCPMHRNTM